MRTRPPIDIAGKLVGLGHAPMVVAEMSGNHNQSLEQALQIVEAAAASGAHAVKLQTYTPDTMTLDVNTPDFLIDDPDSPWHGASLYGLYGKACTPWEWHQPIFERARQLGLGAFSTPFDDTAVDFLEELDAPCYKIASFENTDLSLIRRVASTGKPLLISTGTATVGELDEAVRAAREGGCRSLVLLKCTSAYPASPDSANLLTIPHLRDLFDCEVGLSDHTIGVGVSIAAVALGAMVVERHLTLRRSEGGVDSSFSLEPAELATVVQETESAWRALGEVTYGPTSSETPSLQFRRSLYIVQDLRAGDVLTRDNVRAIRPGWGLPTKWLDEVLGRAVAHDVKRGTRLQWQLLR